MVDRSVSISLEARVSGFVAGIRTAQTAVTGFTAQLEKSARNRQALNTLGSSFGKLGLVAGAGLGIAIAAAANFDQAMSRVQGATGDSAAQMGLLRAAAIKAGADTVFSADEAAGAIEAMAKAGVSTKDILGGGLTGALNLASAGTLDVAQAADIAATTMNQFGLAGTQVTHIADVLAATAGKAQGDVTDMAEALKYVGPVASQMGVSLEETAGTIGYLAKQGIMGSQAGTSLRGMLTALTSPSTQAANKMNDLGISVYDAQGKFVGFDGVAGQLQDKMSGLSNATRDQALGQIFGNQQITAARVLYAGGAKAVDQWTKKVNDSGYAARLAATKMNNLKGDLEQLKGSLQTALIGTGEGAQTPLRGLVQTLTKVVNAYGELPPAAQSATASLLGTTAVLGGSAWLGAAVIGKIATTRAALADLAVTSEATSAALAGIGAVGFAVVVPLGLTQYASHLDDTTFSAKQLSNALGDLGKGAVPDTLDHLSLGVKNFGDALHRAAYDEFPFFNTSNEIDQLDQSLAGLADKSMPRAARAFATIAEQGRAAGVPLSDLIKLFPQYYAALRGSGKTSDLLGVQGIIDGLIPSLKSGKGAANGMGGGLDHLASAGDRATASLKALAGFLDHRDAMRNYEASLDALSTSIKKNGHTFDITTDKGRSNQAALDGVAAAAAQVADKMKGTNKVAFLQQAAADLRDRAKQLHLTSAQVQDVIDHLLVANTTNANPKVKVDGVPKSLADLNSIDSKFGVLDHLSGGPTATVVDHASNVITSIIERMNSLNGKTSTSYIRTVEIHAIQTQHIGNAGGRASGGYITGPGTPTSDSIPAWLSTGEYVMKAAAVDKYGVNMMHRINALGFAGGGSVGGTSTHGDPVTSEVHKARQEAQKRHAEHMAALRKQLGATQKQLDTTKKQLDAAKQFNQSVQQNFRVDPFQNNATLQGVMASLHSDTHRTREFTAAARNAKRLGLDGGVFRALLASGDTSVLEGITTRSQVRALEAAWRRRNKVTADLTFGAGTSGRFAGDSLGELRHEIAHLHHELKRLGHHVRDGAEKGTRKGTRDNRGHRNRAASRASLP